MIPKTAESILIPKINFWWTPISDCHTNKNKQKGGGGGWNWCCKCSGWSDKTVATETVVELGPLVLDAHILHRATDEQKEACHKIANSKLKQAQQTPGAQQFQIQWHRSHLSTHWNRPNKHKEFNVSISVIQISPHNTLKQAQQT